MRAARTAFPHADLNFPLFRFLLHINYLAIELDLPYPMKSSLVKKESADDPKTFYH